MRRFRNILYILDTDPTQETEVIATVQNLARQNDASVRVIRVLEDTLIDSVDKQFSHRIQALVNVERKHADQELKQVLAQPGWQGITTHGEVLIGKDFITVIRKVLEDEHDLVVKARRTDEDTDQFAMRLFRKCPCPVWIISTATSQSGETVIGAVDLAGTEKESRQLNREIVELTSSLAQIKQKEAHFVHAWHLEYEKSTRGPRFQVDDQEIDAMKREIVAARSSAFSQLFTDTGITVNDQQIPGRGPSRHCYQAATAEPQWQYPGDGRSCQKRAAGTSSRQQSGGGAEPGELYGTGSKAKRVHIPRTLWCFQNMDLSCSRTC